MGARGETIEPHIVESEYCGITEKVQTIILLTTFCDWKFCGAGQADDPPKYEIGNPICVLGAGSGDRGDGVGADGNAVCHSRSGGCGAAADRTVAGGSGAGSGGTGTAGFDRKAVLQSANS